MNVHLTLAEHHLGHALRDLGRICLDWNPREPSSGCMAPMFDVMMMIVSSRSPNYADHRSVTVFDTSSTSRLKMPDHLLDLVGNTIEWGCASPSPWLDRLPTCPTSPGGNPIGFETEYFPVYRTCRSG